MTLSLENISKRFDELTALDQVSADFIPGRVHGVLGENGAGKTTLMRIAVGLLRPDGGRIQAGDSALTAGSPAAGRAAGIGMVHQHFMLVPTLTVTENCLLGRRDARQWISRREAARLVRQLAEHLGWPIDPDVTIDSLAVGQQQRVEIVRALGVAKRVLILDEPTAVLTPQETDGLFAAIDKLRRDGLAIIFISHKLNEVRRICDDLTILRRGRCVYSGPAAALTTDQMAEHMVGTRIAPLPVRRTAAIDGPPALDLREICASDPRSHRRIVDINLSVRRGEIVGIAGVEGNGQDVLASTVVGLTQPSTGHIAICGRDMTASSTRVRTAAGLAHIAEDRLKQALVPALTVAENLVLKTARSREFASAGLISWRAVREYAAEQMQRFDIRAESPTAEVRHLSGGNQQKLVLARELAGHPRIIVAQNPVRGLDVAATRFVFAQLLDQRDHGAGILLIHSDLDELLTMADRVAVMYEGRCVMTGWPECDRDEIARRMLGG